MSQNTDLPTSYISYKSDPVNLDYSAMVKSISEPIIDDPQEQLIANLNATIKRLNSHINHLIKYLDNSRNDCDHVAKELSAAKSKCKELNLQLESQSIEIAKYKEQIDMLNGKLSDLEKK